MKVKSDFPFTSFDLKVSKVNNQTFFNIDVGDELISMMDDIEMEAGAVESDSSSVGDPVSGRQQRGGGSSLGSDEMFYIPERRPSLDLAPVDTSHW